MRLKVLIVLFTFVSSMMAVGCGQQQVSFSKHVKPILDAHCLDCHDGVGEGSEKTDLILTSYDSMMKGTKYGAVVVAGNSVTSTLYRTVSHQTATKIQMPPHHKTALAEGRSEPLSEKDIETIKNWIDQGANNN